MISSIGANDNIHDITTNSQIASILKSSGQNSLTIPDTRKRKKQLTLSKELEYVFEGVDYAK